MILKNTYEESRGKEEDRGQKEECDVSLELVAAAASSDSMPVPDASAGAIVVLFSVSIVRLN
jgi:hypothetical protein